MLPVRVPDREVEFTLTEELPSNLRTVKGSVSLLKDRFSSLQRRGVVEYRAEKKYFINILSFSSFFR